MLILPLSNSNGQRRRHHPVKLSKITRFVTMLSIVFVFYSEAKATTMDSIHLLNKTSCFVLEDKGVKTLECLGENSKLSSPIILDKDAIISIHRDHICAANKTELICKGKNLALSEKISGIKLLASSDATICYATDLEFKCLGSGAIARATLPKVTKVVSIALGTNHGCVIDKYGIDKDKKPKKKISCFGDNRYAKADSPIGIYRPMMVAVGKNYSCALNQRSAYEREVVCWGKRSITPPALKDPIYLKSARHFVCAVDRVNFTDQKLVCFGDVVPKDTPDLSSVQAMELGPYTGCAYDKKSAGLVCFGHNYNREVEISADIYSAKPSKKLLIEKDFAIPDKEVTRKTGHTHTCALFESGKVKCWGYNYYGNLGLGDKNNRGDSAGEMGANLPYVDLGKERVISLTVGAHHTCAIFKSRGVKCWGYNGNGELGYGDATNRGDNPGELGSKLKFVDLGGEKVLSLQAGYHHTCALLQSRRVKCWGYNTYGSLGYGDRNNRGKLKSDMGVNLKFIELGKEKVQSIFTGSYNTCAILQSGRVKCWGYNSYGNLGYGDKNNRGDSPSEMGVSLGHIDLGPEKVIEISLGYYHSCARFQSGRIKCWGYNYYGNLGYEDKVQRGDSAGEMGTNLKYVDLGGEKVAGIRAGFQHSCALLQSGRIKCWGYNYYGQLGYGDKKSRGLVKGEMGSNLKYVDIGKEKAISLNTGNHYSCAMMASKRIKCWGFNSYGRLGYGHTRNIGDGPKEMGKNLKFVELGNQKILAF